MIREFQRGDLERFVPNVVSSPHDILPSFEDDAYYIFSQIKEEEVKAIVFYRDTGEGVWAGFMLIAQGATAKESIELREHIEYMGLEHHIAVLWTLSEVGSASEKWHRFIGLELWEITEAEGKPYNMWGKTWDLH